MKNLAIKLLGVIRAKISRKPILDKLFQNLLRKIFKLKFVLRFRNAKKRFKYFLNNAEGSFRA